MDAQPCTFDGCDQIGVFATDDGPRCFVHAPMVDAVMGTEGAEVEGGEEEQTGFAEDVVAGLAAIILDHTAMTLLDTPDAADVAMRSLAEATNMPLDFAAGVLLATSWIVACGDVTDEQLTEGSTRFERQADGTDAPFPADDKTEAEARALQHSLRGDVAPPEDGATDAVGCALCGEPHTEEQHDTLYPLPTPEAETNHQEESSDDDVHSA